MKFPKFTMSAIVSGTLFFSCSQGSFTGGSSESGNKPGASNAGGGAGPGGAGTTVGGATGPGGTTATGGPTSLGTTPVNSDGLSSGDGSTNTNPNGKWYQANAQECSAFCTSIKLVSVADPASNAKCASGEDRPQGAVTGGIQFTFGCWGGPVGCSGAPDTYYAGHGGTVSVGSECYEPGQKQDHDATDKTVACFCK